MHERLRLGGLERAKYFAPVIFCAYLAALCLALVLTSAFLPAMPDAVAITAAGIFGAMVCTALGLTIWLVQRWELRYVVVHTGRDAAANFATVQQLATSAGWQITHAEPGRVLQARTRGSVLSEGEIIAVRFQQQDVLVASICDPGVGFSLLGRRRCRANRERLRHALQFARPV